MISDERLMIDVQQGDVSAFKELVRRKEKPIAELAEIFLRQTKNAWLISLVKRPGVIDDITQDVLIHIYRARRSYAEHLAFAAWLEEQVKVAVTNFVAEQR